MARSSLVLVICSILVAIVAVDAYLGVDVSQAMTSNQFKCLANNGRSFVVIRAYRSTGTVDTLAPTTIAAANAGGMKKVDVYMFPCPKCGNPAGQVTAMINNLRGSSYGMVWLDIEETSDWTGDVTTNRSFFLGLLNQVRAMGANVGVYTSRLLWSSIMGNWAGASQYPLWYASYDGKQSFSDFVPFGGWVKPSIKQYQGTTTICGCEFELNWYPDGFAFNNGTDTDTTTATPTNDIPTEIA